ncbi:hypothetical protein D3C80_1683760 [compost metagenome]
MNARLSNETVEFLVKADVPRDQIDDVKTTNKEIAQNNYEKAQIESTSGNTEQRFTGSEGYEEAMRNSAPQREKQQPIVSTEPKIGRNDPCPCGSGKKYKQCHGK